MNELELKYGCNPNQKPSRIFMPDGKELPIQVLSGRPGYINFLDAFHGWQLVKELKEATGLPAATSFKHVSPAGAAVGLPLDPVLAQIYRVEDMEDLSPLACAYARARGADRMSSFGDFISLSDICDADTARIIKREVSDGVIAPGYEPEALEILKSKKNGNYNIICIDPDYQPEALERKQVFGIMFEQGRNEGKIDEELLKNVVTKNREIPQSAKIDLIISLITLKYTQSNSVCFAKGGQAIGIGAGQQSRIHCTRLAGNKADNWFLRQAPKVLDLSFVDGIGRADRDNAIDVYIGEDCMDVIEDGRWENIFKIKPTVFTAEEKRAWLSRLTEVSLGSDAFFPFGDNIDRAYRSGVKYVAQPGGSVRDDQVIETCDQYGMTMAFTGIRLFHH
ncbi:phosphoribosylaminoimidazolecarboxamide formyltransferase [Lacrimispora sp. BS-2]|uniref:Phosphoribosylaminoimidazolecarboxamide formyltransferase n=1 Tax=Lacrimispora sp. BS-2 TaxID=3151850 RepID=A0AAU7PSK2_9FIRM